MREGVRAGRFAVVGAFERTWRRSWAIHPSTQSDAGAVLCFVFLALPRSRRLAHLSYKLSLHVGGHEPLAGNRRSR
jgi:hypothetical protein